MTYARTRTTVEGTVAQNILTETYMVSSVLVTNNTASPIICEFSDSDSARKFYVAVDAFSTEVESINFIVDRGFRLDNAPGPGVYITVFHGQAGA